MNSCSLAKNQMVTKHTNEGYSGYVGCSLAKNQMVTKRAWTICIVFKPL